MRIRIEHDIDCAFEQPARSIMMALRVMPRDSESQQVLSWRIEPSADGRLRSGDDGFGNLVHHFQAEGPFDGLRLRVTGSVETVDTVGAYRANHEPAPPPVFLRQTSLTRAVDELQAFAHEATRGVPDALGRMHALTSAIHRDLRHDPDAETAGADVVLKEKGGSAQGLSHVLAACGRLLGIPVRIAAGYLADGGMAGAHAWTEAHLPKLGWVGFDPVRALCPTEAYVRVAAGLDATDVAFFRLSSAGGWGERTAQSVNCSAVG